MGHSHHTYNSTSFLFHFTMKLVCSVIVGVSLDPVQSRFGIPIAVVYVGTGIGWFVSSESNLALWALSGSVPVGDSLSALSTGEGDSPSNKNERE